MRDRKAATPENSSADAVNLVHWPFSYFLSKLIFFIDKGVAAIHSQEDMYNGVQEHAVLVSLLDARLC